MADVVLFPHAQGLTDGVRSFAGRLRSAGHAVTLPDLYDGATFPTLDEGVAHAESIGMAAIIERGLAAVADAPATAVYAGFSLGTLPAQKLAQTRPGARGALLYAGGLPPGVFGGPWPAGVALQVHLTEDDPWTEVDEARELVRDADGELHLYPGSGHLVADPGSPDHDSAVAELILSRSLAFLDRVG